MLFLVFHNGLKLLLSFAVGERIQGIWVLAVGKGDIGVHTPILDFVGTSAMHYVMAKEQSTTAWDIDVLQLAIDYDANVSRLSQAYQRYNRSFVGVVFPEVLSVVTMELLVPAVLQRHQKVKDRLLPSREVDIDRIGECGLHVCQRLHKVLRFLRVMNEIVEVPVHCGMEETVEVEAVKIMNNYDMTDEIQCERTDNIYMYIQNTQYINKL